MMATTRTPLSVKSIVLLSSLLILSAQVASADNKMSIAKGLKLPLLSQTLKVGSQSKLNVFINTLFGVNAKNDENSGSSLDLIVDYSYNDILVLGTEIAGDKGFSCKDGNNIGCKIVDKDAKCDNYQKKYKLTCSSASALFRFNGTKPVAGAPALTFKIVSDAGNFDWMKTYGAKGVLGLGPKSPFWAYIATAFDLPEDKVFELSTKLKLDSDDNMYQKDAKLNADSSVLTLDGRQEDVQQFWATPDTKNGTWTWPNGKLGFNNDFEINKLNVCIDPTADSFVLVPNITGKNYDPKKSLQDNDPSDLSVLQNITLKFFTQLCGTKDGSGCKKDKAHFKTVDNMKISFPEKDSKKSLSVLLGAIDFVGFDNEDNAILPALDIGKTACASKDQKRFGVGKLFLQKIETSMKYDLAAKTFSLGVAEIPRDTSLFLPILMVGWSLFIVVVLGIIAWTNLPKKGPKIVDGADYQAAEGDEVPKPESTAEDN